MQNDVPTSRNVVGASACEDDAVVEVGKKFPGGRSHIAGRSGTADKKKTRVEITRIETERIFDLPTIRGDHLTSYILQVHNVHRESRTEWSVIAPPGRTGRAATERLRKGVGTPHHL